MQDDDFHPVPISIIVEAIGSGTSDLMASRAY